MKYGTVCDFNYTLPALYLKNFLSAEKSEDPVFRHTVEDSLKTVEQCFAKYKPGKTKLFSFLLNIVLKFS